MLIKLVNSKQLRDGLIPMQIESQCDLKDVNDGKMIDSLPISMNHFRKDEI